MAPTTVAVQSREYTSAGAGAAGLTVSAQLVAPAGWLSDASGSIVQTTATTTAADGSWQLNLTPQSQIAASGSYYAVSVPALGIIRTCVVPSVGPVLLRNALVDPTTLVPVAATAPSIYLARSELGTPKGVASLDAGGKVPAVQMPPVGGGDARYLQLLPAHSPIWGQPTVVTHFQTGHGWTAGGFGSFNLGDTTDGVHGTQVVTVTTPGNAAAYPTLDKTGAPAINTAGKMIRLWVKVDNPNTINNINIRCAPAGGIAASNCYSWDVILAPYYTGQYLTPAGKWVCLGFSWADTFTFGVPSRGAITEWRIIVNDTGTASTVHFGGIELYNTGASKYPNGAVTLCMDDSYVGQYNIARTVLGQYGYQATLLPIVDVVGTAGYMTVAQMRLLQDQMGWEIAPHASTLANHGNFGSLTAAQIQADLAASLAWMAANGFRRGGSYAYPLGQFSNGQDDAVAGYVTCARTIQSTLAHETTPTAHPLRLRSTSGVGGLGGTSVASITSAGGPLDQCKNNATWYILTMHDVVAGATADINQIGQGDLTTLVNGIQSRGIAVVTMSEMVRSGAFGI